MPNQKLKRNFEKILSTKQEILGREAGLLGNGLGVVNAGVGNWVYVRTSGGVETAICDSVTAKNDLAVWVGKPDYDLKNLHILGHRALSTADEITSGIKAHHEQHEYFGDGEAGGTDVVRVQIQQIRPLRLIPTTNPMQIAVYPGIVWIDEAPKIIGTHNSDGTVTSAVINFGEEVVTNVGKAKFALVYIDDEGEVSYTAGSEVNIDVLDIETNSPAIPDDLQWVLGEVRIYYGQVEIIEHRLNTDIIDMRWYPYHRHKGNELSLGIVDLSDVEISDITDGELLAYDIATGKYINQTLEEAGIASTGDLEDVAGDLATHVGDTDNPHQVTAEQVGLGTVAQDLINHKNDYDNPHQVQLTQLSTRWEVLTNGDPVSPELMFDEHGDVLYVEVEN